MFAMQSNDWYEMSNDLEEVGSVMEGMTRKNDVDVTESVMLETAIELSATEPIRFDPCSIHVSLIIFG